RDARHVAGRLPGDRHPHARRRARGPRRRRRDPHVQAGNDRRGREVPSSLTATAALIRDHSATLRRTLPTPRTSWVTFGSPMYSTDPAPDTPTSSAFCARTTTLPAPLTETVAVSLSSFAARYSPAPEIRTFCVTVRPATSILSAPDPLTT